MLQRALSFFGRSPEAASAAAGAGGGGDKPPDRNDIIPTLDGKLPADDEEEDTEDEDQDVPDPISKKARTESLPSWRVPEPAGLPPLKGKWAHKGNTWVRAPGPPSTPPPA